MRGVQPSGAVGDQQQQGVNGAVGGSVCVLAPRGQDQTGGVHTEVWAAWPEASGLLVLTARTDPERGDTVLKDMQMF